MMKKIFILAISLVCSALMSVSCIYPFEPEAVDGSGALVIEGDILIGRKTVVKISHTAPVSNPNAEARRIDGEVWVENDAGTVFQGISDYNDTGTFTVDTQNADPSRNYRMHFLDNDSGKEYVSEWVPVCAAPVIDSLSYNIDYEKEKFNVALSMHSLGHSYFKWSYVEDWEYHSMYDARLKAIYTPPTGWGRGSVTVEEMDIMKESRFYCYRHEVSSQILTFSTEKQTDDRFVDLEFLPIARNDNRISTTYRIVVDLEPLTKDAYLYWENIKANSEYNGNLFAPSPSELVGNIRCVQEPDEMVMGYISAAQIARDKLVVTHIEINFYKDTERYEEAETVMPNRWLEYYNNGYLPYDYATYPPDINQTLWAPYRCVDCRARGGAFQRPEDWQPSKD